MSKTRRDFLRNCVALGAAGTASLFERFGAVTAHAQASSDYRALVCVFLYGGNDSNNMIVPIDSRYAKYAAMRGPVALGSGQLLPAGGSGFGFHQALPNIQRLYNQNAAAVALNVGTLVQPTTKATLGNVMLPANLRSHADQLQQWQSSDPNGGETGWGGRISDLMSAFNTGTVTPGLSVNHGNPFFLSGARTGALDVSNTARSGILGFDSSAEMAGRIDSLQRLLTFDSGLKLVTAANGVLGHSVRSLQEVNAALAGAPAIPVAFPDTGIGQQCAQIAKLMSVRGALGMNRQIFFAGIDGFDNHEGLLVGHENLLTLLDEAVGALFGALDALGLTNQVTLFTESEFNRTITPNASMGTDHAWGGHHLIIGGAVGGGSMYGAFPTLELGGPDDIETSGTWIPTSSLDQYAATLAGWFGVNDADLNSVFPNLRNFPVGRLGFLPTPLVFSNDPLVSANTGVRSIHLTELRTAIAVLRTRYGLSAVTWTDPALVPGVTTIKSAHLTEMRGALNDVYEALSRTPPSYANAALASGTALITAQNVAELRAAVRAVW